MNMVPSFNHNNNIVAFINTNLNIIDCNLFLCITSHYFPGQKIDTKVVTNKDFGL